MIDQLTSKPKIVFLLDSVGAFLTVIILFTVLKIDSEFFGMPKIILAWLTGMAACYCIYSTTCYWYVRKKRAPFIMVIGIANLVYCLLTIGCVISNYHHITIFGITYFSLECIIIMLLVYVELQVAKAINKKQIRE